MIRIRACCKVDVTIGHPRAQAEHADGCNVPYDTTDSGLLRRIRVMTMLSAKLDQRGVRTTVVIDGSTGQSALLVHPSR